MLWFSLLASLAFGSDDIQRISEGRLLLDGHLLIDVERNTVAPLRYPMRRRLSDGHDQRLSFAVSPSSQVALVDPVGKGVFLGLLDGTLISRVDLPGELSSGPADVPHAVMWLDDRRLLLQKAQADEAACGLLDATDLSWTVPVICPPSELATTIEYIPGSRDWFVVLSEEHGQAGVSLVRWSLDSGVMSTQDLQIDAATRRAGMPRVFFFSDGDIRLLVPCGLQGEECGGSDGHWLYAWLPNGDLRFLRKDLPAGVIPVKEGNDFLWVEGTLLCKGDPSGQRRCTELREPPP